MKQMKPIKPSLKKILVVGPAWVGDMVMAQTLFITLKKQHPDCQIDVLAPAWSVPLLSRMPEVHRSIALDIQHKELKILTRLRVARSLAKEKYQQAILMPNSFKSALIPFFAGIPKRTGWLGEWRFGLLNDIRFLNRKNLPLMIQRFIALGLPAQAQRPEPLCRPKLVVDRQHLAATLEKFQLSMRESPILALCPGAEFGPAKRWPEHYYAEIAAKKIQEGWQVWLFGSVKDAPVTHAIQTACGGRCVDLAGKTKLAEAIDLLSLARLVVSNDSGLMHIASALARPTVVIYGSSSPDFTPPLSDNVRIVRLGLTCSPCFKRTCPLTHLNCLTQLTPDYVLNAMQSLVLQTNEVAAIA